MSLFCAGLSHHNAPVELREKFAIGRAGLEEALRAACALEGIGGAVILSTCNRVEFYLEGYFANRALEGVRNLLRSRAGADAPLYFHEGRNCARHLFRVASGLDSLVLGETEILGQLKQGYAAAQAAGAVPRGLHKLFQHAFRVAKHVRTETHITRGPGSVGAVAAELAAEIFGDLSACRVMILGAGDTSERTARSLVARGAEMVIVSNRHFDRAARLAGEIGGRAIDFDHWPEVFSEVDILICSTAAPHAVVTAQKLAPLISARGIRPLFVIDLAVPRDAEPAIAAIPGVHLYDIDSLEGTVRHTLRIRRGEVARCERMIADRAREFFAEASVLRGE